jgi:hypothetical protein
MKSNAETVAEYLASLPEGRRTALEMVRQVILNHLAEGYQETIQYGMISYVVPHSLYPAGYYCNPTQPLPYASLGSQKNHMAIYLMCNYRDAAMDQWFRLEYAKTGKKLDMDKSCIRFKKIEDLALEMVGAAIARTSVKMYIQQYEESQLRK